MKKRWNELSNVEIIALGFAFIIIIGTLLLMLPVSTQNGVSTPFLNALFTATSACCVTGLVVVDTATHWSIFGQCVILLLIQIGGLGFITIGVFLATFLKRKISLKQRGLIEESVNTLKLSGGVKLVKHIIKGTFVFEGLGVVLLSFVFIPDFGYVKGIYYAVFHSISAFCNAGFDLMGVVEPYCSLVSYVGHPLVNITVMSLIVIGGLGFVVWEDIYEKKWRVKNYLLQTKVVLTTTMLLIVLGAALFYIAEGDYSLVGMSQHEKVFASFFQSITARTAGFNTVDVTQFSYATRLLMMILMFVGGSPGSTAGGIKTTTLAVLMVFVYATIKNKNECQVFNRRFDNSIIKKAFSVFFINILLIIAGSFTILFIQPELVFHDVLFEVFSALGTVGISTGITRELISISKIVIILLMYSGRVGSLTFALSLTRKKKISNCINPAEKVAIG